MEQSLIEMFKNNCDGVNFFINSEGDTVVESFQYLERGEEIPGSELGKQYDIVLFHPENPQNLERFQAILISPPHYISSMIDKGFLGMVGLATTKSDDIMEDVYNRLKFAFDETDSEMEE